MCTIIVSVCPEHSYDVATICCAPKGVAILGTDLMGIAGRWHFIARFYWLQALHFKAHLWGQWGLKRLYCPCLRNEVI